MFLSTFALFTVHRRHPIIPRFESEMKPHSEIGVPGAPETRPWSTDGAQVERVRRKRQISATTTTNRTPIPLRWPESIEIESIKVYQSSC